MANNDELYINDELIELGEDSVIAINKAIQDVASLQTRNADHTNQFKIPHSGVNNIKLGHAKLVQSTSNKPYRKLDARYISNGVELIHKGLAIIENVDDNYNITVNAGNFSFFDLIKELDLRDIDLSAYNHQWNILEIRNSRTNTSIFKYPLVDYGTLPVNGNTLNVKNMYPAFFTHSIIRKIVEEQGCTLEGDVLNDQRYLRHLILWSNDKWETENTFEESTVEISSPQQIINYIYSSPPPVYATWVDFEDSANIISNQFTAPDYMIADINATVEVDYTTGAWQGINTPFISTPQIDIYNVTKSQVIAISGGVLNTGAVGTLSQNISTPRKIIYNISAPSTQIDGGDQIVVRLRFGFNYDVTATVTDAIFSIKQLPEIAYGQLYSLQEQLPDISQGDFFKEIMNQFGLIPDFNPLTKKLTLKYYHEIIDNIPIAKDWSDKIDDSEPPQISFRIGDYAQLNKCIYKHDEGVTIGLGDSSFSIDDEVLPADGIAIESFFGASDMVDRMFANGSSIRVPYINKINTQTGKPQYKTSIRFAIDDTKTTGWYLYYNDGVNNLLQISDLPFCYFIDSGQQYNLDWETLLNEYYPTLIASLRNTKVVRARFNLELLEVHNFNHFIPVYISKFNSYFYVNVIENFKHGQLTTVELIRI